MNQEKLDRILTVLQCTSCGESLKATEGHLTCSGCQATFAIVDGSIDFLDEATSRAFRIEETENVSDHPFDGNAMTFIHEAARSGGLVLDCGSGFKSEAFDHVVQLEIVNYPNVDVRAVNQKLPFVDSCFDVVFSANVLEHVDDPFVSAMEITRVLKPGGFVYVDIPFLQAEHGYPNHYFNATRQGLQRLFPLLESRVHQVPMSGHPIFTLRHIVDVYRGGLPPPLQVEFLGMTLEEFLERSDLEWLDYLICTELSVEAQWHIASTTQAILQKPDEGGGGSTMAIVPEALPGFRARKSGEKSLTSEKAEAADSLASLSAREHLLIEQKRRAMGAVRTLGRDLVGRLRHRG
jgi:SAM-dependent methyltransferase